MKIATWNLERPKARQTRKRAELEQWLRRIDADVWVLTETHECIRPGPDYCSVATTEADRQHEPGEHWTTIWSRYPIERVPVSNDPSRCVAAVVRPPGRAPLVVYGTVLPWRGSAWRGIASAGGKAFIAALKAQLDDWLQLQQMFPEAELCVAGDFNQDLSDQHYYWSNACREALRGALAEAGLVCTTADPHDPVRKQTGTCASIDHICVSEGLFDPEAARHVVWPPGNAPTKSLSDHFGVMVEIALRRAGV